MTETTVEPVKPWQFKKGVSGNPGGRPKGARHKLAENFLSALSRSFELHGEETLERVRVEEPAQYVKVVASLLPKELTGEDGAPLFPNVTILFGKDAPSE